MAGPLRIETAGGWYHVTARGNERRAIFRDDTDRRHWLALLEQWVERFEVRVHAYVLMDNHYHLLLETRAANLTQAMQWLQVSYTVWFNRRHRRSGHLFQGRYRAILLEGEALGWELSRYIHLNPVRTRALGLDKVAQRRTRAGVNGKPEATQIRERLERLRQFRWSSYRAYTGLTDRPQWLTIQVVLASGDGTPKTAQRQRYRQYVEEAVREGLAVSPWERLEAQVLLGGAEFVRRMKRQAQGNTREQPQLKRLRERPGFARIVAAVESEKGESWKAFRDRQGDWGRDVALYLGRRRGGMRLRQLAEAAGGIDYGCAQIAVHRLGQRLAHDQKLRRLVKKLERELFDVET
jgi:REP element-mobilizing transposase RayT